MESALNYLKVGLLAKNWLALVTKLKNDTGLPTVGKPAAIPLQTEELFRKLRARQGRAATILAGDVSPDETSLRRRTLLS